METTEKNNEEHNVQNNRVEAWNDKWIPFLDWHTGDFMCLDMNGSFGGKPGQIIIYFNTIAPRYVQYPDVRSWLRVFVIALQNEPKSWEEWEEDDVNIDAYISLFEPGYPKKA